ncbi:eukaryotic translation initiation factor 3 subunit K-like isoform X2 [Macadamia integrifolia]|uniref:eukaryotic translation initiation factor 3 subunit K-like isoform X2 n=1 Tax=Macadamia integrifolia TaxID=60698 RepID=UPI001C4E911E|nr:eukaryotic translation initiation factor 3 subunit K-like isoform X2 [Macadamia integrifolia]
MGRERDVPKQPISYTVEQLVAVNPYNPDILPDLENYVNEQFEPERMSIQIIARILVKALMAMPAPDFSLCLFLIPERVVSFSYPLHLIFLLNIDVLLVDPFCWG